MQKIAFIAMILALFLSGKLCAEPKPPAASIAVAIRTLRGVDVEKMTEAERKKKSEAISNAWEILFKAGPDGATALLKEVKAVNDSGKSDDFFMLGASALLWGIGELNYAPDIAAIWDSTPLEKQYTYVFQTAVQAAAAKDPKVLPMLRACLKNKEGSFFAHMHAMNISWPMTVEFIWGIHGPSGDAALLKVLKTSKDAVALQSTIHLLSKAYHLEALPLIRKLATAGKGEVREVAILALGTYGHPDDFDLLLKGVDGDNAWACVYALYEYGDQRAVKKLIPLLKSKDQKLRRESISAVGLLATPESVIALMDFSKTAKDKKEKEYSGWLVNRIALRDEITEAQFRKMPLAKQKARIEPYLQKVEAKFKMKADDRKLSRKQFKEAVADWIKRNRITGGKYSWVYDRHILRVTTPADIIALRSVKASVYRRISDECLQEVRTLDGLIRRLARSQYRQRPGITPKASLPKKK